MGNKFALNFKKIGHDAAMTGGGWYDYGTKTNSIAFHALKLGKKPKDDRIVKSQHKSIACFKLKQPAQILRQSFIILLILIIQL